MAEVMEQDNAKNPELIRLLQSNTKSESETTNKNPDSICSEWPAEEANCLFNLIKEYSYFPEIKLDNDQVYTKLSKLMTLNGYRRVNNEIKSYWKELQQKYEDYKEGKLEQFEYLDQVSDLFHLNSNSDSEIIVIKGEELESNVLVSHSYSLQSVFNNHDYQLKNGKVVKRNNWTHKETECVVEVLEKYGMPNRTNLRKFCYVIVDYLKQHGFMRSEEQAQVKIKHLRALHNRVLRKTIKEEEFPFFKRIQGLIQAHHQDPKIQENEEPQNYISLDEHSKSDTEDGNETDYGETVNDEMDTCYKKTRQIWTNKEIGILLKFIEDNGIITGKQLGKVCSKAVDYLASHGYCRTPTQILIRWKNAKALYWATYRKKAKSPEKECSFFYQLHAILNPNDCYYEPKHFEIANNEDDTNFYEIESISELPSLNFKQSSREQSVSNFKKETINNLNNSNSSDNFVAIHNVSSSKRFQIAELPIDPLENDESLKISSSSPKRSRTEQSDSTIRTSNCCSFCSSLDHIDHYCISLAHSIKKLDARKQAKLKIEIQQLMYKAEFDSNF